MGALRFLQARSDVDTERAEAIGWSSGGAFAVSGHYFDVEGQAHRLLADVANRNKPNDCCGATVGFDAAANVDAHRRVAEFFGRHLSAR